MKLGDFFVLITLHITHILSFNGSVVVLMHFLETKQSNNGKFHVCICWSNGDLMLEKGQSTEAGLYNSIDN